MFEACGLIINGEIDVKAVQQALVNAGLHPGKVDGVMGEQTKKTLVAFQKSKSLRGDGVIGLQTLSLLAQYLEDQPEAAGVREK